jgi:allophanate hydrolase
VTRTIILGGAKHSAVDAFRAFYRLADLRRDAHRALAQVDALMVPTVPAAYTVADIEADPIRLNRHLGVYTHFVNLLDLAGIAVPAAIASDGTPFGVTFLGPAGQDAHLASLARVFHASAALPLGATGSAHAPLAPIGAAPGVGQIAIAVVGAHLSGMPLNGELRALGGRFLAKATTAPDYRLFALGDTQPPKPGLLRVADGVGSAIELELWALSGEGFGRFVAGVPPPLSIGTLALADGTHVKGFLVEAAAIAHAPDISSFGGWRAYMASRAVHP